MIKFGVNIKEQSGRQKKEKKEAQNLNLMRFHNHI